MDNIVEELEEYQIITKTTERRIIMEERIKKHFKDNKDKYKVAGLVVVAIVGAVAVAAGYKTVKSNGNNPKHPKQDTKVDTDSIPDVPVKGRRGDAIYNKTRDESYGSIRDAAKALDTTKYYILKNLEGSKSAVDDKLEFLGENLTPVRPSM